MNNRIAELIAQRNARRGRILAPYRTHAGLIPKPKGVKLSGVEVSFKRDDKEMQFRPDRVAPKGVLIMGLIKLDRKEFSIGPVLVEDPKTFKNETAMRWILNQVAFEAKQMFASEHRMDIPFEFLRKSLQVRAA